MKIIPYTLAFHLVSSAIVSAELVGQLGILNHTMLNGFSNNPATFQRWKAGDTYRLVFQTSAKTTAESSSIHIYNAWAQGLANASPLNIGSARGVTWKVIGSTDTVDARDNTSTNPGINGTGCPIYQLDGKTLIASTYTKLWSGSISNPIRITEQGVEIFDSVWPFTGTYKDGTKATGKPYSFSALGGMKVYGTDGVDGRQIGQGRGGWTGDWVWRYWTGTPPSDLQPMYVMSEVLSVVDTSAPLRLAIRRTGSSFEFTWNSRPGKVYDLVSSPTLETSPSTWPVHSDGIGLYQGMNPSLSGTKTVSGVEVSGEHGFFSIIERDP